MEQGLKRSLISDKIVSLFVEKNCVYITVYMKVANS